MADLPGYISDTELFYDTEVTVVDQSDVCNCTPIDPTVTDSGGGTGAGAEPVQYPMIGTQVQCAGAGLVPTQADLTFSETWWG